MSDTDRARYAALCQAAAYCLLFGRRVEEARTLESILVAAVALCWHLETVAGVFEEGA